MQFSGTPTYMAPELFEKRAYNESVDVFALGTLIYELYASEVPYHGLDPQDIKAKVVKESTLPLKISVKKPVFELSIFECSQLTVAELQMPRIDRVQPKWPSSLIGENSLSISFLSVAYLSNKTLYLKEFDEQLLEFTCLDDGQTFHKYIPLNKAHTKKTVSNPGPGNYNSAVNIGKHQPSWKYHLYKNRIGNSNRDGAKLNNTPGPG